MVLDGSARKLSLITVLFSILGWMIFVAGLGIRIHNYLTDEDDDSDPTHHDYFPYWYFAGGALVLYIIYFIHLYLNKKFTQYLTIFFVAHYFIAAGGVLYMNGMFIAYALDSVNLYGRQDDEGGGDGDNSDDGGGDDSNLELSSYYWVVMEFTGVLISVFFYWISMMCWPCFKKNRTKGYYDY